MQLWLAVEDEFGTTTLAVPLPEGEFVVGRGASCGLVIPSSKVSRKHVLLKRRGQRVDFRDSGSKLGTLHNGLKSDAGTLAVGDRLQVHRVSLRLSDTAPKAQKEEQDETTARLRPSAEGSIDWEPFGAFLDTLRLSTDPKTLLDRLLRGLVDMFQAERGYVLLSERPGDKLVPVASHRLANTDEFVQVSSTVYNDALKRKNVVVVEDSQDSPLCGEALSLSDTTPRTIVCAPLRAGGRSFGVIYVDMPCISSTFQPRHVKLFETITGLAAGLVAEQQTREILLEARERFDALNNLIWGHERLVLGEGDAATELKTLMEAAASQDVTVVITGETGTGKEMIARSLHGMSNRHSGPFVPVNCAALPHEIIEAELFGAEKGAFTGATESRIGRFELASSGTLFLDEIGELPSDVQVKLLRVLEERCISRLGGNRRIPLDIRLVCATNKDLESAVRDGSFRQDLYYRVNVFRIDLKPLRDRPEDVHPLAQYFLSYFTRRFGKKVTGFSPKAEKLIFRYPWPGNIRELRNAIERAVVIETSKIIQPSSLPIQPLGAADSDGEKVLWDVLPQNYEEARDLFERTFLKRCLDESEGNVTDAAKATGMTRCAIYRRLEKLGLVSREE